MKTSLAGGLALLGLLVGSAEAVVLKTPEGYQFSTEEWWSGDRMQVGTRITVPHLLDATRGDGDEFLNHLNHIDVQDDYAPTRVFVDYWFDPSYGAGLTWERLTADLKNEDGGGRDGEIELSGPILTYQYRYNGLAHWTPYCGLGLTVDHVSFKHTAWHRYGFDSEEAWRSVGSPEEPRHGKSRHFRVDDTWGWVGVVGADIHLDQGWSLDLYLRYTKVEVDMSYSTTVQDEVVQDAHRDVPFDNVALGLGVRYSF